MSTTPERNTTGGRRRAPARQGTHDRGDSSISDTARARANYKQALAALADQHLTRTEQGLLAARAARALARWRNTSTNPNFPLLFTKAVAVLDAIGPWTLCDGDDLCDRCIDAEPHHCRFITTPRRLLSNVVYAAASTLPAANAAAYLYGRATRPLTGKADWARVRTSAPGVADSFAITLASDLRRHGRGDLARPVATKLWKAGVRDPHLTTLYAALIEDDKVLGDKLTAFRTAARICEEGLGAAQPGDDWSSVEARLARLRGRINASAKEPAAAPYNTRAPHRPRFVRPRSTTAA